LSKFHSSGRSPTSRGPGSSIINSPILSHNSSRESNGAYKSLKSIKKPKLTEKQKREIYQDLFEKTKLDRFEIFNLEEALVMKGVKLYRINPKSISKA
jgi:hypothetical protein